MTLFRFSPLLLMGLALTVGANMLSPLLDLRRSADAQWQCNAISKELKSATTHVFLRQDLAEFLEGRKQPTTDPWGMPFRIERSKDGLLVRSAGPDRIFESTDDVVSR